MALWICFFFLGGGVNGWIRARSLTPRLPSLPIKTDCVGWGETEERERRRGEKEQHVVGAVLYKCGKVPPLSHTAPVLFRCVVVMPWQRQSAWLLVEIVFQMWEMKCAGDERSIEFWLDYLHATEGNCVTEGYLGLFFAFFFLQAKLVFSLFQLYYVPPSIWCNCFSTCVQRWLLGCLEKPWLWYINLPQWNSVAVWWEKSKNVNIIVVPPRGVKRRAVKGGWVEGVFLQPWVFKLE